MNGDIFSKDIKFEAFNIFAGLFILIGIFWLFIYHSDVFEKLTSKWFYLPFWAVIISGAGYFIYIGVGEVTSNFYRQKQIRSRQYILKKYELDLEIENKQIPKKYLDEISLSKGKNKTSRK